MAHDEVCEWRESLTGCQLRTLLLLDWQSVNGFVSVNDAPEIRKRLLNAP